MPKIILKIETDTDKLYEKENVSCYMIADSLSKNKIEEAKKTGKMVLSYGDKALDVCKQYDLDGVVKTIDVKKPLKVQAKALRESLKKKTLGLIVPARRHEAMLAGEIEPECLGFYSSDSEKDADVISWYNDLFLIPLAWVEEEKMPDKSLDVDFIIINSKNFKNFGC